MIEPVESTVRANGLAHRVLTWGADPGRPLVLAHGYLDHAWSFHFVAQSLVHAGRRVVAFDWRGHGESERVGAGGYYHFTDYVLDLSELMPQLAPEGYDLLGHSMGGTACAMFAGTRPAGLRTLVLCEGFGPPTSPPESLADRLTAFVDSVARERARQAAPSRPMADLDDAMRRLRVQHPGLPDAPARFLAEKGTRPRGTGREWCFDPLHRTTSPVPFQREGLMSLLARIEVPTLSVRGARGFATEDHAERLASLRDVREVVLDDAGHMMHWEAPEALAAALVAHTSSGPQPGANPSER